jgi:hypothetical protein
MVVARRVGSLTIHFLGDNAERHAGMFDDAYSRSKTLRRDMDETSRTHRNIYVGSALADLQDQPNFGEAEFDPQSKEARERPAFGKAAGAETHFIVVKPGPHSLIHGDRRFEGSAQLALVHELLHPSQMIRELADQGGLGNDTERQTQMCEQRIAAELGMAAGKDFPDVIGSGATYDTRSDPQPNSSPAADSVPVDPIGYYGPVLLQPTRPTWREAGGSFEFPRYADASGPATRLTNNLAPTARLDAEGDANTAESKPLRYLSSRIAGRSAPPSDVRAPAAPLVPSNEIFSPARSALFDDRVGSQITPPPAGAAGGSYRLEPPQPATRLPGLVSGEPMEHLLPPSIFGLPEKGAPDDEDWLMQLLAPRGRR